ncbi:MAG: hypothetical protein UX09_C0009G0017 [Candidatus Uhrbacteria bacterium GW2011_GWE2_45_35]|uniref:Prepilin-type N-terminal cleavage/methylation domain-containing protein n=2 Tax=Candidatus Uhriibacteriota TaxID=1752732 RepID=A0A0G1J9X2_9BACT|nr:MAG: hypothetical protein UW63_C0086G0004 [Candidatus Uhrbacteria bacterium GW2011_GWF2_44_350]KKU08910.1 MAG: hypothetical protein UX09_C0009G0017 [Candidatus Uhrbacteria bacterium GW2011_GWE2_45_35]HBR80957.1 hypothetical protein [Candidatus Uhrbacteria bacterium]HCU31906.1 hypothetical protein [Candidatus Uhrbacteria bacterium]
MIEKNQKGITLIETVVVIALLIIVLPITIFSLVRLGRDSAYFSLRQRISSSANLIFSELSNELTSAQFFSVSTSTLGVNPSTFIFTDQDGLIVTIDRPTDTVAFPGGNQEIKRLRLTRGPEVVWLTDADVDVTNWMVQAVRDSSNNLTGIRIQATFVEVNKEDLPFRNIESTIDFTINLPGSVTEL